MQVSSKHMMFVSPVFKAMLTGNLVEVIALHENGKVEITLPEDDAVDFTILIDIVHGKAFPTVSFIMLATSLKRSLRNRNGYDANVPHERMVRSWNIKKISPGPSPSSSKSSLRPSLPAGDRSRLTSLLLIFFASHQMSLHTGPLSDLEGISIASKHQVSGIPNLSLFLLVEILQIEPRKPRLQLDKGRTNLCLYSVGTSRLICVSHFTAK